MDTSGSDVDVELEDAVDMSSTQQSPSGSGSAASQGIAAAEPCVAPITTTSGNSNICTLPWGQMSSFDWNEGQVDWGDITMIETMPDAHHVPTTATPVSRILPSIEAPLHPLQVLAGFSVPESRATSGEGGGGERERAESVVLSSRTSTTGGGESLLLAKQEPDVAIAQLTQLSARLSLLHRSAFNVARTAEKLAHTMRTDANFHPIPLLDDAAFASVAAWLARGSNDMAPTATVDTTPHSGHETKTTAGSGILHDIFSTSQRFLEVMRLVETGNGEPPSGISTPSMMSSSSVSPTTGLSTSMESMTNWSSGHTPEYSAFPPSGTYRNTDVVVRHMVFVCHTLLLDVYSAVAIALEHDGGPNVSTKTGALGAIRLASVLQLCSYLIERQHQAVELYFSPKRLNGDAIQVGLLGLYFQNVEMMKKRKKEVQQKLTSLQQALCT